MTNVSDHGGLRLRVSFSLQTSPFTEFYSAGGNPEAAFNGHTYLLPTPTTTSTHQYCLDGRQEVNFNLLILSVTQIQKS